MDFSGPGTAIMFAVAAVLWFVYLIPTWFRRREYLATERNATRIQQTLRIMAETAEAPAEVRLEATARGAAQAERLLREQERQREERERAALARVRSAEHPDVVRAREARTRLRRGRMVTAAILFIAVGAIVAQLLVMAVGGVATGAWVVLGIAGVASLASFCGLRRLATRRIPAPVVAVGVSQRTMVASTSERGSEPRIVRHNPAWTPVPVPKPLYLSSPEPQRIEPSLDAERRMREAAAAAERALRAAHAEPEIVAFPSRERERAIAAASAATEPAAVPAAVPSRWASMGIVDEVTTSAPDIDASLRRRRAVG